MAFLQYSTIIVLVINLYFADGINIRNVDTDRLIWAPMASLKSPFVTFINDFNFPTWATRHQITKENYGSLHLQLAKGVPFALVCGACFQRSIFKPNLTIDISDHTSISVAKMKRDRSFQFTVGLNECLMTYLITEPIKKDGKITCTLNRGKQVIKEEVTFGAVDVDIQEPPEDLEVQTSEWPMELHCPQPEKSTSNNPSINIWHEEHKPSDSKQVGSPILSTKTTVYIEQPRYTINIVCSVYNIFSPGTVQQIRYKIRGSQSNAKSEYHVSGDLLNYEGDAEILPPRISLSSSVLAIIIMAAVVCVLLAVIGTYRFFAAAMAK